MQTIDAAIAAVTVFPNRARITRRGRAHLAPGEDTLVLEGLSPWIIEDSVRASGRGAGAKIVQAEVTTEFVAQPPEQVIADLQKQLVDLQDKDRALVDDEAASAARLDFLTKLRESSSQTLARGLAFGNTTLERVQAVLDFTARELDGVNARRRELAIQRRDLKREIAAAQGRL